MFVRRDDGEVPARLRSRGCPVSQPPHKVCQNLRQTQRLSVYLQWLDQKEGPISHLDYILNSRLSSEKKRILGILIRFR